MNVFWLILGWVAAIAGTWRRSEAGEYTVEAAALFVMATVMFVGSSILLEIKPSREK